MAASAKPAGRCLWMPVSLLLMLIMISWPGTAEAADVASRAEASPAGRRVADLVAFINGVRTGFAEYIQSEYAPGFRDRFPLAMHTGLIDRIRADLGQVALMGLTEVDPYEVEASLASTEEKGRLTIHLQVEATDPHRIVLMGVSPGEPPDRTAPDASGRPGASSSESSRRDAPTGDAGSRLRPTPPAEPIRLEDLDDYLAQEAERGRFSGTVLVAERDRTLFHQAYGFASKRFGVPNALDTRYNLASIGKLLTTIAVTQLVEQGRLDLDAAIGTYLEGFPPEVAEKVTVRHLLNGQSGWGDYWEHPVYRARRSDLRTTADYLAFIREMPLDFAPGTSAQHSNTGFLVAGAIIEAISGQAYDQFLQEHILSPAGMVHSGLEDRDGPVENLAVGYTNRNPHDPEQTGFAWDASQLWPPRGTACGGAHATTGDLRNLARALGAHRLLSPGYTAYMLRGFTGSPEDPSVPGGILEWAGGTAGASTYLGIGFDPEYTIIVLSNYDPPCATDIAGTIKAALGF